VTRLLLYRQLAEWWPLCSAPEEYKEEAGIYRRVLVEHSTARPITVLELGSGGGNNASHLKKHFQLTLVDLSPGMLRVSKALNPECTHVRGDMRTVRLGTRFDAVFIHDAIDYMLTLDDLTSAFQTAFVHCRPGGVALFVPDETAERFRPSSSHGGHDQGNRGLRYLEWTVDHDPNDG
jgi:SAM-dependent methyltransferase